MYKFIANRCGDNIEIVSQFSIGSSHASEDDFDLHCDSLSSAGCDTQGTRSWNLASSPLAQLTSDRLAAFRKNIELSQVAGAHSRPRPTELTLSEDGDEYISRSY